MSPSVRQIAFLILLGGWALLPSCRSTQGAARRPASALAFEKAQLASSLRDLAPSVSPLEARRVSEILVDTTEHARVTRGLTGSAVGRNLAVNLGWHDWGLCWHWTELLGTELGATNWHSLRLHWACAHSGSVLREHNALVFTAAGQPFADGLVIDPWRENGRLTWKRVRHDRYPWQHEPWSEVRWKSREPSSSDQKARLPNPVGLSLQPPRCP